jgi:hypothetical protein
LSAFSFRTRRLAPTRRLFMVAFAATMSLPVTLECHAGERHSLSLGAQRHLCTIPLVRGVVANSSILRCLHERTVHITEAEVKFVLMVEHKKHLLPALFYMGSPQETDI